MRQNTPYFSILPSGISQMNLLVKGRVLHTITGYNFKQDLDRIRLDWCLYY
jgi:hypothetical protein